MKQRQIQYKSNINEDQIDQSSAKSKKCESHHIRVVLNDIMHSYDGEEISSLEQVKRQSMVEAKKHAEVKKQHTERLDALLQSNGLVRKSVPEDGDCFFHATLVQLREKMFS